MVRWWTDFLAWLRPLPQIVTVPQAPITVHVEAPVSQPFVRSSCVRCVFWLRRDKTYGECRAKPPLDADVSTLGRPKGIWALTTESDWCGECRSV